MLLLDVACELGCVGRNPNMQRLYDAVDAVRDADPDRVRAAVCRAMDTPGRCAGSCDGLHQRLRELGLWPVPD